MTPGDPERRTTRPDGTGPPRDALETWTADRYAHEDVVLRDVRAAMEEAGLPLIQVPARTALVLHILVRATGASRVLEIGTLGGYSAVWMGRALPPGGRLVSLEKEPAHAAVARASLRRAGLEDRVEVREGEAAEILPGLPAGSWDLVFIDADKEGYPLYLREAARLLRPGGLLLADNAFWSGRVLEEDPAEESTRALQAFHRTLADSGDFTATVLPVGDGVALGVRS